MLEIRTKKRRKNGLQHKVDCWSIYVVHLITPAAHLGSDKHRDTGAYDASQTPIGGSFRAARPHCFGRGHGRRGRHPTGGGEGENTNFLLP